MLDCLHRGELDVEEGGNVEVGQAKFKGGNEDLCALAVAQYFRLVRVPLTLLLRGFSPLSGRLHSLQFDRL